MRVRVLCLTLIMLFGGLVQGCSSDAGRYQVVEGGSVSSGLFFVMDTATGEFYVVSAGNAGASYKDLEYQSELIGNIRDTSD